MVDVFIDDFAVDFDPPAVSNRVPAPSSIGVATASTVSFDVTDLGTGVDLSNTIIRVNGTIAWNGSAYVNGHTGATTTITNGYHFALQKTGGLPSFSTITIQVDSQDFAAPPNQLVGFTWTFNTADEVLPVLTISSPANGSSGVTVAPAQFSFDLTDPSPSSLIDLTKTNIVIDRGGNVQNVMLLGVQQAGYTVTVTPIANGYHYLVVATIPFGNTEIETITASGKDNSGNTTAAVPWSFTTVSVPVYHARPYITNPNPFDTSVGNNVASNIVFTVRTDDTFSPATAIKPNELVKLNGVTIVASGVNVLPGQYSVTFTYGLRQVIISIHPILPLANDTVYRIDGVFEDDAGNVGTGTFEFSTGLVEFAIQIDRQEPLLCPIDNIPVPLFVTNSDAQVSEFQDSITSFTTDWANFGLLPYDGISIPDGPDKGRWLLRSSAGTVARIYHIFGETSATKTVSAFTRQEFADRNPVDLVFSPLFDYKFQKIWGDTQLRYLAGYPSDTHFPNGFHDVPIAAIHDSNNSIAGHIFDVVDGTTSFSGTGAYNTDLSVGSVVRFGNYTESYVVQTTSPTSFTVDPSKPFSYHKRMTGTVSVVNGSFTVNGTGTVFTAETNIGQYVRFDSDPTNIYRIVGPFSNAVITLLTAYLGPTTTTTVNVASLQNVEVHRLDNTNGGVFDDQTNQRLDFNLVCGPPVTTAKWDRYSMPLLAKIKPILTDTAALTPASGIVNVSGTSFRTELHVGAVVTFGSSTTQYSVTHIDGTLQQFTVTPVWGGLGLSGQAINRNITGTRILTVLGITAMADRSDVFIGMNNSTLSPTIDNNDRVGCAFLRRSDGVIEMHGWLGTTRAVKVTDMHVADLLAHEWVLETEFIDPQTVTINLLSFDDISVVDANRSVTVQNTTPVTALDRWTITTLGTGAAPIGNQAVGYITYVDVEPGQGVPFDIGAGYVTLSNVKPRCARNVHRIPLAGPNGYKTLNVAAATFTSSFTASQYDRIFWDVDEVVVVIDNIGIEGGAVAHLNSPSRSVKKFSFNQGFDQINISFRASRRGYWFVLVDSDDPRTGLIAARGLYDVANAVQNVLLDGMLFDGLADGLHTLNVVLCKEPVPSSWVALPATATITAIPNVLKTTGATIYGIASLSATADVTNTAEEDTMVLENLTSQVAGGAGALTLFTTSVPYKTGKIKLILDGVIQNFNPIPLRVVETNNLLGQVSLSSPPGVNQKLVAEYVPL